MSPPTSGLASRQPSEVASIPRSPRVDNPRRLPSHAGAGAARALGTAVWKLMIVFFVINSIYISLLPHLQAIVPFSMIYCNSVIDFWACTLLKWEW